jgi:rod shape-determining protein MreD
MKGSARNWLFAGSYAAALILKLMSLPSGLAPLKPYWLALVLAYWAIEAPERVGLGFALLLGFAGDLLVGDLLGEQAMRLVILTFIVLRFRARLRFFPMWQQTLAILALLLNDRVVVMMIRGFAGDPMPPAGYWLGAVTGMFAWPLLCLLLGDLRSRLRAKARARTP